jgi:hypothetical protein
MTNDVAIREAVGCFAIFEHQPNIYPRNSTLGIKLKESRWSDKELHLSVCNNTI